MKWYFCEQRQVKIKHWTFNNFASIIFKKIVLKPKIFLTTNIVGNITGNIVTNIAYLRILLAIKSPTFLNTHQHYRQFWSRFYFNGSRRKNWYKGRSANLQVIQYCRATQWWLIESPVLDLFLMLPLKLLRSPIEAV